MTPTSGVLRDAKSSDANVDSGTKIAIVQNTQGKPAKDFFGGMTKSVPDFISTGSRSPESVSTILGERLPTRTSRATGTAAVGSFPFDPAQATSQSLTIAVLRIGDPEPRGNAVRTVRWIAANG